MKKHSLITRVIKKIAFLSLLFFISNTGYSSQPNNRVLLLSPSGENFEQTIKGLKDDIADEVIFIEKLINAEFNSSTIAQYIKESNPALLVFLGNKALYAYSQYQQQNNDIIFPPGIAISALFLDNQLANIKNTTGIRYEIPAVTSAVQIRSLLNGSVKKIGVIHRAWMTDYIQKNKEFCKQENIELVSIKLPNKASFREIRYHLKHLIRDDIDALWVVNDNDLLSARLIQNVWIPSLKRFKKPVIVGIDALTSTSLNFGTFSVVPDHYALGIQGAEIIAELKENDWKMGNNRIVEPISIKKLLNVTLFKQKNIHVNTRRLAEIDTLIQ